MKSLIPWVLVAALLAGGYFLFAANREKEAENVKLRQENSELEDLQAEVSKLKKAAVPTEELVRLRKENEDVPRLRGEIRKLRLQVESAEKERNQAQQQGQQLLAENQRKDQELLNTQQKQQLQAQLLAAQQAQQTQPGAAPVNPATALAECINHLRQIDGAKQTWALENRKTAADVPSIQDLTPYLPKGSIKIFSCPAGGAYSINSVQQAPTCSTPGHVLQ